VIKTTKTIAGLLVALGLSLAPEALWASPGTAGASFLDIPVGAGPAALGSAYTAMASDAYAPVWNPGGLGFVKNSQLAAQQLSYLEGVQYEFASFVDPLAKGGGWGASIQYLGSGNIAGTDINGNPTAAFTASYAAYSLAYGQSFGNKLSVGITGKIIDAKISDVSADAYGFDLGGMYRVTNNLRLAGTLTNVGTKLTFIDQGDPLPLAVHLGAAYTMTRCHLTATAEGVYPREGLASAHAGLEWSPVDHLALRLGYGTETLAGLSPLAGLTTGIGIKLWGYELAYTLVPMGALGNTQYFSVLMKFGGEVR
jgi:hypothetical protein